VLNEIFQLENTDDVRDAAASKQRSRRAQTCYLIATVLATIAWVWLIAWCALKLV
jgi:hypothetical protein